MTAHNAGTSNVEQLYSYGGPTVEQQYISS
jgi:hypothetical protein